MSHVKIVSNEDGGKSFVVDGVDLSMQVLAEGFRVELAEELGHPDRVHVIFAADTLEVDLADAVVEAAPAARRMCDESA